MHDKGMEKGKEFYLVETYNHEDGSKIILEDFKDKSEVEGFLRLSFKAAFPQIRNVYKVRVIEEMIPEIPTIKLRRIRMEATKQ